MSASRQTVHLQRSNFLPFCIKDPPARVLFVTVEINAVDILLVALFIDKIIQGMSPNVCKVVPIH